MRTQYLFLKFLRSFTVGLAVGFVAAALIGAVLFALYLSFGNGALL